MKNNTTKFFYNSILITIMLVLTVIYYNHTQSILIPAILTIFLSILFCINLFLMIHYINYQRNGNKKVESLMETFLSRWFKTIKTINKTILLTMVISATSAVIEFYTKVKFSNSLLLFVMVELILVILITVEFTKILETMKEFKKIKLIIKKCNEC